MNASLKIYHDDINYEATDKLVDLIYLQNKGHKLVEIGLNIKISNQVSNKEEILSDYIYTGLLMNQDVVKNFLSYLDFHYQSVGVFMKFSEGKHPIDCLTNFFMKYCREYEQTTLSLHRYLDMCKRLSIDGLIKAEENLIPEDYIKETRVHYEKEGTIAEFDCEEIWIEKEDDYQVGITNQIVSLFLKEEDMKKAHITFLNPCGLQ